MRRIIKDDNSEIVTQNLKYIEGNSANNQNISKILFKEQKGFCAYTEEYIGRADARDIEHFNPNLKGTNNDAYSNLFLVKHQWNSEKSSKWDKYQPVLYPTDENFNSKIIYDNGDYRVANSNDVVSSNLVKLIKLDDLILADERKKYIRRKKDEIEKFGQSAKDFFDILIQADIKQISYLRAIQEEFKIDIWNMIPQPQ
jgi:HNH endonuclease